MKKAKRMPSRFPRLKRLLTSIYDRSQGLPPVSHSVITKELIRECVGKEDPTILEIGCNDGSHTAWFLEIFENPQIYCFEPEPRAIRKFKSRLAGHPNISLHEIALSDRDGQAVFHQSSGYRNDKQTDRMPQEWDLSGSIRQPKKHLVVHPWVEYRQQITIETSTLDTWCHEHGISDIDFIWMDVQGAEIDVFRGGSDMLKKTRFIYTEYSNKELYEGQYNLRKLLKYLEDYSVIIRYPGDVLIRNKQLVAEKRGLAH